MNCLIYHLACAFMMDKFSSGHAECLNLPWHGSFQKLLAGSDEEEEMRSLNCPGFEQESCVTGVSDQISDACTHEEEDERAQAFGKRRKRKRVAASKRSQEVESQRMTHIQVERDRRKQMNAHLNVLRSMLPESYLHKGDQASIVGGAIDLVKELEQLLQTLKFEKLKRKGVSTSHESKNLTFPGQRRQCSAPFRSNSSGKGVMDSCSVDVTAETDINLIVAEIEVTSIESHGSIKILSKKKNGQLLGIMTALESFHLTVLHLNITTLEEEAVLLSLNVKMEEQCRLTSARDVATALHHIIRLLHSDSMN